MQSLPPMNDTLTRYYTTAIDALCEVAHAFFFLGRLGDALHVLGRSLDMVSADEVAPLDRLKLLLLYGRVLNVNHLVHGGEPEPLFATIRQAQQLAEGLQDEQCSADAWSLCGQTYCNTTTMAIVKSGALPFGSRGQGRYAEAFADQQRALKLQEMLHDTHGISESHFFIGLVQQFWQQNDLAREHFMRAIQVAEENGYVLEQAEPNRHLAFDALFGGDLDRALTHALRALAFRESAGFRPYQPLDHLLLKDIYLRKADAVNAQVHMQRASTLAEEMGCLTLVSSMNRVAGCLGGSAEDV